MESLPDRDGVAIVERGAEENIRSGNGSQGHGMRNVTRHQHVIGIRSRGDLSVQFGPQPAFAENDQPGPVIALAHRPEGANLQGKVVLRLQPPHTDHHRLMVSKERLHRFREIHLRNPGRESIRLDFMHTIGGGAESLHKQLDQGAIDRNQSIEAAQNEAAESPAMRRLSRWRRGVPPRMEGQHRPAAREQTADESHPEEPDAQVASDVQVDNIPRQPQKQTQCLKSPPRKKDVVVIGLTKASQIDYPASDAASAKIIADGHQIGLHTPMGRRKRSEQKNFEAGCVHVGDYQCPVGSGDNEEKRKDQYTSLMTPIHRLHAVKNVLGSWLGLGTNVLVGFFITPYILHHVGDTAYGIWVLLTAFTGYYGLLDLGLRGATLRYVARHMAVNEIEETNRVISTSFFFLLGLGLALMALTFIVFLFFGQLFKVGPEWQDTGRTLLLVVGLATALNMPLTLFNGVMEGLQRFSMIGIVQTGNALFRVILLLIFLDRGYHIVAVGVITMLANLLSATTLMALAFHFAPTLKIAWRYTQFSTLRTLGNYGIAAFWITIAQTLRFQFDAMVIGWMISAEAITFFSFGSRLSMYSIDVVQMMAQIFTPMASAADATGEHRRKQRLFILGNRYSAFVALPLGVMFLLIGRTIIRVWVGAGYVPTGYTILVILIVPTTIYLAQAGSVKVLYGIAKHQTLAVVLMIEAIVNLVLSILLVPYFGLQGVAWGTAIPLAVTNIFFLPLHLCRLLKVRLRDFLIESYSYPVLAVIPFGAALWAADRWIQASRWLGLLETLAIGGLAYGSALFLYYHIVERKP